jgi:hypothetical protein
MGNFKYSKKFYSLLPIRNTRTVFSRLTGRSALNFSVRHKALKDKVSSRFISTFQAWGQVNYYHQDQRRHIRW